MAHIYAFLESAYDFHFQLYFCQLIASLFQTNHKIFLEMGVKKWSNPYSVYLFVECGLVIFKLQIMLKVYDKL